VSHVVQRASGRPVWVVGQMAPGSGWSVRAPDTPGARRVSMTLEIHDDGGGYLLVVASADRSVYADSWCVSLEDAVALAHDVYGDVPWERVTPEVNEPNR